jgi:hypothetical protein
MKAQHDEDGIAPASNDAYTGMLSISLLALVGASVFLYLDYNRYGDAKPPEVPKVAAKGDTTGTPVPKPKPENTEFHIKPPNKIELAPEETRDIEVRNGKAASADVDGKDKDFVTAEVAADGKSFKITVSKEATEQVYTITIKSDTDKTATLELSVKNKKKDKAE